MNKVKIGVFGGARGFVMIKQLLHHPDAELVAVCDKYEPLLDKVRNEVEKINAGSSDPAYLAEKNNAESRDQAFLNDRSGTGEEAAGHSPEKQLSVALYTDFDEFIKHDMDAVVLANYANEHAVYAVKCLNAGKHVMSEVLPAETPAQMVELVETVEKTGLIYAYAENYCYMKAPFEMRRRYDNGDIGTVQYCEGEYIHDCSEIWPTITYGDRDHWRNRMFPTFYCTHSCGPLIYTTGLRPVQVVGFETNLNLEEKQMKTACPLKCGIEMITLENGAVLRSVHGGLKREPHSYNFRIFGTKGTMESALYNDEEFGIYREGAQLCRGEWEKYDPVSEVGAWVAEKSEGHGGSDFYTVHCFVEKILGKEDGKWSIDVYTACDMGLCGLMAWRSVLAGNQPMRIPNFRLKEDRDRYRDDNACCSPAVAKDSLLPRTTKKWPDFPDETFANVKKQWLGEPNPVSGLFAAKENDGEREQ